MCISDWSSDVCSSDPRRPVEQILRARKQISGPAEDQRPEGEGADGERRGGQAEVIVRHALLDQVAEHDEHDELERRHLAEFALAEQADQQEQDEEHRRGAKNDIHQGSTLMRSGIAPMRRSPSNTAISPRVPANSGGLIWPSILTWRRSPASSGP